MGFKVTTDTPSGVNIRSGPGTEYGVIGTSAKGNTYDSLSQKKDANGTTWHKVGDGWVCGDYMSVASDGSGSSSMPLENTNIDMSQTTNQQVAEETVQDMKDGKGIESQIETDLKNTLSPEKEMEFFRRRTFAVPHQFLDTTDYRPTGGNLGRVYATNILTEAPILSLLPSKPRYLPSLNSKQKKGIIESLLSMANDMVSDAEKKMAEDAVGKVETKYFGLELDSAEYHKYVNTLLVSCAVFMGIGDKNVPGTDIPYKKYRWENYRMSNMLDNSAVSSQFTESEGSLAQTIRGIKEDPAKMFMQAISTERYYVNFMATPATSYSESMSNRTEASMFEGLIKKGESLTKELSFLLGAGGIDSQVMQSSVANMTGEIQQAVGANNSVSGVLGRLLGDAKTIISGSNIIFPEIYHDSDFSRNYRAEIQLISPYGDKESIFLNIMVPMMHILPFVLPRQTSANSYGAPILMKAHINKWFSSEMAIMDNLDILKGGSNNDSWSVDGFPTEVTMSISIKDLYSSLMISKIDSVDSALLFVQNEGLIEYLSVLCGLDMKKSEYKIKTDLVEALLSGAASNAIDNTAEKFRQKVSQMAIDVFGGFGSGGRI